MKIFKGSSIFKAACAALIALCLFLSIGASQAHADSMGAGTVTATALNIRSEASATSSIVTTISKGTVVLVTGSTDGWYQVWYHGYAGYISADYLTLSDVAYASFGTGTVVASEVNIRSEASTSSSVIASVEEGATMLVTGVNGSWYQVSYNGSTGYVNSSYMTVSYDEEGDTTDTISETVTTNVIFPMSGTGTIRGTGVSVRAEASTASEVLAYVSSGTTMTVTGTTGDWYQVEYNDTEAYVSKSYMAVSFDSETGEEGEEPVYLTGMINASYVRLRSGPSTTYKIIDTYDEGTIMNILGATGDWYQVECDGVTGYVYATYLTIGDDEDEDEDSEEVDFDVTPVAATDATVTTRVNIRTGPSTSYYSLGVLSPGTSITVTGTSGDWYEVLYDGTTGYISGKYVDVDLDIDDMSSRDKGEIIAEEAQNYLGVSYVYGGASPSGFDCSGFIYYVYKQCGYKISRTATSQSTDGVFVSRSDLQPGDILIFSNSAMSGVGHVGIYLGSGKFIHCSAGSGKVVISSLTGSYYSNHYLSARRIVS